MIDVNKRPRLMFGFFDRPVPTAIVVGIVFGLIIQSVLLGTYVFLLTVLTGVGLMIGFERWLQRRYPRD